MALDVPTLMLAGSFVAFLSGAMLVFAWHQYREMSPVLWWAASDFVLSAAIALLVFGGVGGNPALTTAAFAALTISPALLWTSARLFNGMRPSYLLLLLGPLIIVASSVLPASLPMSDIRGGVGTALNASYLCAAAWTLLVRTREPLVSRWPLAGFILAHVTVLMTGAVAAARSAYPTDSIPPINSIFGIIHFEALIFVIGTTIFVVAAMRESSELTYKRNASTDPLTGLANRRDFLDRGERLMERCRREDLPLSIVMLDLDRFKDVNDGFGHAVGDRVLQTFADAVRRTLRPNDLVGRIGGEEFAAILPGSGMEAAMALAERTRRAHASVATTVDGHTINSTVSAGIASTEADGAESLAELMKRADAALYRAKQSGRNRVVMCDEDRPENAARVVRVA